MIDLVEVEREIKEDVVGVVMVGEEGEEEVGKEGGAHVEPLSPAGLRESPKTGLVGIEAVGRVLALSILAWMFFTLSMKRDCDLGDLFARLA